MPRTDRFKEPNAQAALPDKVPAPQLPESISKPPSGGDWAHEVKVDGYRMLARVDQDHVRLVSRTGVDWTKKFSRVAEQLKSLSLNQVILDGEMTVLAEDGTTRFSKLRGKLGPADLLVYYVFDVLYCQGRDIRKSPLEERKVVLADLLSDCRHPDPVQRVEHFDVEGQLLFDQVVELGLEGVVSKRRAAPYTAGKSRDWLKTKNKEQLPFIICGFEYAKDGGFELLLGYHDEGGQLVYAGRAGLGFTIKQREELDQRLKDVRSDHCPFTAWRGRRHGIHWLEPTLVAVFEQGAWKGAGFLREAAYLGLRDDIAAEDVSVMSPS